MIKKLLVFTVLSAFVTLSSLSWAQSPADLNDLQIAHVAYTKDSQRFPNEPGNTRVRAQGVELVPHLKPHQCARAHLVGFLEPEEGSIEVAERSVDRHDGDRWHILVCRPSLQRPCC